MPSFPYKLITFDVTGTLLKPKSVFKTYADFAKRCGIQVEPTDLTNGFKMAFKTMDVNHPNFGLESGLGWRAWWSSVVKETFKNAVPEETGRIDSVANDLIEHYAKGSAWSMEPQSIDVLKSLKSTGAHLGVISNFDPRLHRILRENDLSEFFSFVLTSYEAKCTKPNVAIFRCAAEIFKQQSGVPLIGEEALHVGDNYDLDYMAARGAGWQSILVSSKGTNSTCKDCLVLKSLQELKEHLVK
uniref:Haloacid dehalogenase-like hydrolase domain-containing protein 3 n=1 Tax=Lygus hesperus TaxID=30085 RepID=A0A0A9ZAN0_LYGHE